MVVLIKFDFYELILNIMLQQKVLKMFSYSKQSISKSMLLKVKSKPATCQLL